MKNGGKVASQSRNELRSVCFVFLLSKFIVVVFDIPWIPAFYLSLIFFGNGVWWLFVHLHCSLFDLLCHWLWHQLYAIICYCTLNPYPVFAGVFISLYLFLFLNLLHSIYPISHSLTQMFRWSSKWAFTIFNYICVCVSAHTVHSWNCIQADKQSKTNMKTIKAVAVLRCIALNFIQEQILKVPICSAENHFIHPYLFILKHIHTSSSCGSKKQRSRLNPIQFDPSQQHKSFEIRIFWKFIQKFAAFYFSFLSWLSLNWFTNAFYVWLCVWTFPFSHTLSLSLFRQTHANLDAIRNAK